jgi:hypothetical protein
MESDALKIKLLKIACLLAAVIFAGGCPSAGIYSKVKPAYDLSADKSKKVLIWVESPRSAAADPDAADKLAEAMRDHLVTKAGVNPANVLLARDSAAGALLISPDTAALQAGAATALFVRIEEYELLPMSLPNYHSGRMVTRSVLLDAQTGQALWPMSTEGKVHDIVVELGKGDRQTILTRLTAGSAHCILRNLYPITKLHYKYSDERVSLQEAFEQETF